MHLTGQGFVHVKIFLAHAEQNRNVFFPDDVPLAEHRSFLHAGSMRVMSWQSTVPTAWETGMVFMEILDIEKARR